MQTMSYNDQHANRRLSYRANSGTIAAVKIENHIVLASEAYGKCSHLFLLALGSFCAQIYCIIVKITIAAMGFRGMSARQSLFDA